MKKVLVGISGGVDSAVSAILLKEQGYEVIGATFVLTDEYDPKDAISVCQKIGIKHHILDYKDIFKENIKDTFIQAYKAGLTPNPCVLCNKTIKFKYLYDFMIENDIDYIATGHYAKVIDNKLYQSSDLNKDQTYFLSQVDKKYLDRVLFPLEGISKDEVRKIALKYGLENHDKKDSYDVCFITNKFKDYMNENVKNIKGDVIDVKTMEKVGEHKGLSFYTIGQRKGLDIGGTTDRMFVVGKDLTKNILYVTIGDDEYLISDSCIIENVNFISDDKITNCQAKFRYRQNLTDVSLEYLDDNKVLVKYKDGVKSVTPGQTCVFYKGNECLGGGTIKEVRKNNKKLWYLK